MGTVNSREAMHRRRLPSFSRTHRKSVISTKSESGIPTIIVNPVKLVKHQVVLSDHVSPMSSLSAAVFTPLQKSASWRKSNHSFATRSKNSSSSSFSHFDEEILGDDDDDDDENGDISPRTSTGSDMQRHHHHNGIFKINNNLYDTNYFDPNNIVFESKYHLNQQQTNEKKPCKINLYHNDEKEYDRQLRQHYVLKQIINGNIHVPITKNNIFTILNSGCGAGLWTMDVAQEYPQSKVIGLDIFSKQKLLDDHKQTSANHVKNIIYKYGDITTNWDIPDASIDLIYQRDTIDRIPKSDWPRLLHQFKRIAKKGAYLELVEYKFVIKDPGPALALLNEWHKIISTSIGVDPNQADYLESLLGDVGFEDVRSQNMIIPVGEWPTDKVEREKGFLYKQVIQTMFKSMKSIWITKLGITDAEYTKVTNAALSEFEEEHASVEWVIITARKP